MVHTSSWYHADGNGDYDAGNRALGISPALTGKDNWGFDNNIILLVHEATHDCQQNFIRDRGPLLEEWM